MRSDFGRGQLRIYAGEVRCPRRRFQSEREEETRDRAERGSVVRGSDQASVAPKRTPSPTTCRDTSRSHMRVRLYEKIIKLKAKNRVWKTRLTGVVLFLTSVRLCLWYE